MSINKNIILLLAPLMIASGQVIAQDPDLPTEEVDVIKNFDAELLNTERIPLTPELPPLDTTTKRQNYNVVTKTLNVDYLPPKIRPLAMRGDRVSDAYKGYLKAGGGLPAALLGEASYDFFSDKKLEMGINVKHHSANNTNNVENQRTSLTQGGIDGTYYFDQGFAVNGRAKYTAESVFFYGYNDLNEENGSQFSFPKDDVKQSFGIFDVGASIFNGVRTEADFNYHAGFDYYFMQDDYAARENGFILNLGATKWFNDAHPFTVNLITDLTNFKNDDKQTLNNFFLQPSYTYHSDVFKVKVGANVASADEEFSFFPDIEGTVNIIQGVLGAFVGAGGSLDKNTFRKLTDYNPYLVSMIEMRNTKYYSFYGGVKGNISGIDYNAQVGYKTADDLALFLIEDRFDPIQRFEVIYDNVNIVNIKGSVSAPLFDGFTVIGTASQSIFSPESEEKAWHLPTLEINAAAVYMTMEDALRVRVDFFLENGVPYQDNAGNPQNLNALFDISLGAEYFFSEHFGAFANINNIANNRRQRWHRYPVFGLNALAGLTAKF